MATYFLTGGGGFIGSHLADRLIATNNSVVIIDDLSTGSAENINTDAYFYEGSVTDKVLIAKIFSDHKFFE